MRKVLLFGHFKACADYAHSMNLDRDHFVHVTDEHGYIGREEVEIKYCGPFDPYYHNLFLEAKQYLFRHGEIEDFPH